MLLTTRAFNTLLYARYPYLTRRYRRKFGKPPNYANPSLYSEKVQWRKVFDRNPLFPLFLDKLEVRHHVARTAPGLRLPELLWSGSDPLAIPYHSLGNRYVIKPNCRSGDWHFVLSAGDIDREVISDKCRRWMISPHGKKLREWGYSRVKPRLLVERLLCPDSGDNRLQDFRFDVFDGCVRMITVTTAQIADTRRTPLSLDTFYDRNWQQLPFIKPGRQSRTPPPLKRPSQLENMIAWAEQLGHGLDYVRVDLYLVENDTYFSELTVYPGSGLQMSRVSPEPDLAAVDDFDSFMGGHWKLPEMPRHTMVYRALLG
ncbi:MAG: ATP-grasp fold amidoligase family protein [Gammaproteobacteria bacterium]|nr:ATP-grasp fold amidoligase family protein [Gammaproteobacteria bacterium]